MEFKIAQISIPILVVILLAGCKTQNTLNTTKPAASKETSIAYTTATSFVMMPLEIQLKDVEKLLNSNVNGLIYNDSILEDDKTEMKIWKQAPILLTESNGKVKSVVPLKIWAKIKYGTDFMGLNDTREFNLNGKVTLNSDVRMSNWKLQVKSVVEDVVWQESPTVMVAGKQVYITYLINPAVKMFKTKLATKIDDALNKVTDFKPQVVDVLKKICEPIEISPAYESWFSINPIELYSTEAVLSHNKIKMDLGLKCSMQTLVGNKPNAKTNWDQLVMKAVTKMPNQVQATVAGVSTYENASRIITKNFKGQTFASGSKKVTIENVALWERDKKIIVELEVSGTVAGKIYLSGIPKYAAENQEIYFENMEYVLDTKGVLTKTANWLLSGVILKKIQENCRYSIAENLNEAKKNIVPYMNNYSPMPGVFVNGKLQEFSFDKMELSNNAIITFLKLNGTLEVKINGI